MATANDALKRAAQEVGYHRHNDPLNGTKYGRWYAQITNSPYFGMNGVPYCAMFVAWVFNQVGQTCPGMPTASVYTALSGARNAGIVLSNKRDARPGDLVIFDWEGDGDVDHIGFVEVNHGSYIQTIEGNTSSGVAGSQGDGGGVYRRTRDWSVVYCAIRVPYSGSPAPNTGGGSSSSGGKVDVDGWIGMASWSEMQRQLGCKYVDGLISGQPSVNKPYVPRVACTVIGSGGSLSVIALQKFLNRYGYNLVVDGYFGPATVLALQKWMTKELGYKKHAHDSILGEYTAYNVQNALNAGAFKK